MANPVDDRAMLEIAIEQRLVDVRQSLRVLGMSLTYGPGPDEIVGLISQYLPAGWRNVAAHQATIELEDDVGAVFGQLPKATLVLLEAPLRHPQRRDIGPQHEEAQHFAMI